MFEIRAKDPEGHALEYKLFGRDPSGNEVSVPSFSLVDDNWIAGNDPAPGIYEFFVRVTEVDSGVSTETPVHLTVEDASPSQDQP